MLVVGPQLLGGAYGWGATAIGVGLVVALALVVREHGAALPRSPLLAVMCGAWVWTALQRAPLPEGLVELLQPDALVAHRATALALATTPPQMVPLTLDARGTELSLVVGASILLAFGCGALLARQGRREDVVWVALASISAMGLVALAHEGAGATRVFGLYTPRFATPTLLAPLLNPNHLGGFLSMGVPLAIGLTLAEGRRREQRWALSALAATLAVLSILSLSRGAIASLAFGGLAMLGMSVVRRSSVRARLSAILGVGVGGAVLVLSVAAFLAADRVVSQFVDEDYGKLELLSRSPSVPFQHPWVGTGRGAFSTAFVGLYGTRARFEYAECLPIQWAADWGFPCAALLLAVMGASLVAAGRASGSWARVGAIVAVATIAVHDLVDYALELPGVAAVAAALLGAAVTERASSSGLPTLSRPLVIAGASTLALAIVALGPTLDARSVLARSDAASAALARRDFQAADGALRQALSDHPGEPALALLAAHSAVEQQRSDAPRWLNRTMQLAPEWSAPHVLAARWLVRIGASAQAYAEVREAERLDPGSAAEVVCELLTGPHASVPAIVRAAPEETRDVFLDRAARCVATQSPIAAALDEANAGSALAAPQLRAIRRAIECGDMDRALHVAEVAASRHPGDPEVIALLGEILVRRGELPRAEQVVREGVRRMPGSSRLLALLATVQAESGDEEGMRETIERLRGRAAGNPERIAAAFRTLASIEERLGNLARALHALETAQRIYPEDGQLRRIGSLAQRLGDRRRALAAWTELCRQVPSRASDCESARRLREHMLEPSFDLTQPSESP